MKRKPLPWTTWKGRIFFLLSIVLSVYLTLAMPAPSHHHHKKTTTISAISPSQKIADRALSFGRLFLFVGLGAMLGGLAEGRCWYRHCARSLGRLTKVARLPAISAMAMPTALASGPAADSMLSTAYSSGKISEASLLAGGVANSFLARSSHSLRIAYPVVAAIGIPGFAYFLLQLGGEALVVFLVLAWHRLHTKKETILSQEEHRTEYSILPWREALKKSAVKACALLFRLACISVPLVLAMEYLLRSGSLQFWDAFVPEAVRTYFPEQILAIVAAQMGGLVQSSAVAAGLLEQGLATASQVLLAMLVASGIGNPFRTLRRNLPTALAIFPTRAALIIVFGMQIARLLVTSLAILAVVCWIRAV